MGNILGFHLGFSSSPSPSTQANPASHAPLSLSVIMPVYNEAKTVEEVIRKVLEQAEVAELITAMRIKETATETVGWGEEEWVVVDLRDTRRSGE